MIKNKIVAAIIAEYNPFHNGHEFHIQKTRELTGADYIVILMSTNYVQRGEPAILDRYLRAESAIYHGADAVFELPVTVSTGSSDIFSLGSVSLAHKLGFVDFLSFGAEEDDLTSLLEIAELLHENEALEKAVVKFMAEGLTFPESRERFLQEGGYKKAVNFLSSPNNILGVNYITSLLLLHSSIKPIAIKRTAADHHSSELQSERIASAKAIRLNLREDGKDRALYYLPKRSKSLIETQTNFMNNNDFSDLLFYKLNSLIKGYDKKKAIELLSSYQDVSNDLAHRLYNYFSKSFHFSDYTTALWGKNYTYSRINRAMYHIILDITKEVIEKNRKINFCPYIRPLAIKKDALDILTALKDKRNFEKGLPLLTRIGDLKRMENSLSKETFELNRQANHLYNYLSLSHHATSVHDEEKDKFMMIY